MGFDYSYKLIPFYICFLPFIQFHLDRQFAIGSASVCLQFQQFDYFGT